MSNKKVLFNSDKAAVYESRTLTGWWCVKSTINRRSNFFGKEEFQARYDGCTHMICKECGKNEHRKGWSCCKECRAKHDAERYAKLPKKPWDGESLVVPYKGDEYFDSVDAVYDYCDEHNLIPEDLMLCHCEGIELPWVDINDHFQDCMTDNQTIDDIPDEIIKACDALNEAIMEAKPMAYTEAAIAVDYPWATDKASEGGKK